MESPLIAVDVGNSRVKFGLFDRAACVAAAADAGRRALPRCRQSTALPVDAAIPWPEIRDWLDALNLTATDGIIAGANPVGVDRVMQTWPADDWPRPRLITNPDRFPLEVDLPEPSKIGIDRLLNSVAANVLRPETSPAIIVDCGTATTVDLVSPDGTFQGGAILPGFELTARALHEYTALLPRISVEELAASDRQPLGRNTRDALHSGLFWGQLGAIKELVARLAGQHPDPFVLLTGGGASLLAPEMPGALLQPQLALQGLAMVSAHLQRTDEN